MISNLPVPQPLPLPDQTLTLRRASESDLTGLMQLLADDPISSSRGDRADDADSESYRAALRDIIDDPSNDVILVTDQLVTDSPDTDPSVTDRGEPRIVGTMQLTRIPCLARRGTTRLMIEAVRVDSTRRSAGIGTAMINWAVQTAAPAVGAGLVQLTSDDARTDAHRFYERLGFVGSHRGFKLQLA